MAFLNRLFSKNNKLISKTSDSQGHSRRSRVSSHRVQPAEISTEYVQMPTSPAGSIDPKERLANGTHLGKKPRSSTDNSKRSSASSNSRRSSQTQRSFLFSSQRGSFPINLSDAQNESITSPKSYNESLKPQS